MEEDYKPRSPDLSGLNHDSNEASPYGYPQAPPRQDSFSLGSSSYYQPPPLPHQSSSTAYSHSAYEPPIPKLESQPSWQTESPFSVPRSESQSQPQPPQRKPGRPKKENSGLGASQPSRSDSMSQPKMRKMSSKGPKPPPPEPEPRPPAPGDAEGINVRTKFPVARIKRLVQADEEVGKVAQSTPVSVGKALELFMIQLSLTAMADAGERGSKRLTAQNIKVAINHDETFDFLREIGDKIPEGTQARSDSGKKMKPERAPSDEEMDVDDGEAGKAGRKRRRRKPTEEDY